MPDGGTGRNGRGTGIVNPRHPILETTRLRIRPSCEAGIPELLPLVGAHEVAATTLRIVHPYTERDARSFLALAEYPNKIWLAISVCSDRRQIDGIGLRVEPEHQHAELGYWLGVAYWGQGYATEAAREMVRYDFEELGLYHTSSPRTSGTTRHRAGS